YGGVYADLDYSLTARLDDHRRFYAVVTREPEVHSLQFYGIDGRWPLKIMPSPAFLMAAPGHNFYRHCVNELRTKAFTAGEPLTFAGPLGLTGILRRYADAFTVANSPLETVYIPPSYSFYPYENNRMNTTGSIYLGQRQESLTYYCKRSNPSWAEQLRQYCADINNLDPIIDKTQPVVAKHDMKKSGAIYDGQGSMLYSQNLTLVSSLFGSKLQMGSRWI
uniref:Glycosyl transferase n=1 Tax=Macrostomum lignano TaxID=282301 RepID=A0A1I8GTW9_9PLAT